MRYSDAELFRALAATGTQREEAISQLRELLFRGVSKSLKGRYGKSFSAEDIVQEALIKILGSLGQFHGKSKFATWSMSIAIRIGISELRRKYHAEQSLELFSTEDHGVFEVASDHGSHPDIAQEKHKLLQDFQGLIDHSLTEKQRLVIRAYLSDFSTDGIANATGLNRNAVYKLLHDARVSLKKGLEASGYSTSEILSLIAVKAGES